jgi:hypothetical protein
MIYALVEPSIYMIASILPTTRHLYRRLDRKAREARSAKSNSGQGNSSDHSEPAELRHVENGNRNGQGITRHVDIWQPNTNSSEEELTLGECYGEQQKWNPPRLRNK